LPQLAKGSDMVLESTLVSIIIPVRNGERFLRRTLASALAQTYSPIEVIVVDDGSTDRTAILVEAATARDNRIRLFRRPKSGVAGARNFGISQARGNLIAPLDADDLWHPEKIARQIRLIQASPPEVGLVYCWSICIDEDDFVMPPIISKSRAQGRVTAELAKTNILENSSSPLIRRSCIDAVGGYDTSLQPHGAEDWKLYLALSEICEFTLVPEHLVGYRQSTGSLSRDVTGMAQSTELVVRWMTEKWPDLAEELKCRRTYNINSYLADIALGNNQCLEALRYWARACMARPVTLLGRSNLRFGVRILTRMAGFRRPRRKQGGAPVPFEEFQATNVQTNS
jgi:glycosyltransferase involved in cell wall biosynthesis